MEITIKAKPEDLANLILAIQNQQNQTAIYTRTSLIDDVSEYFSNSSDDEDEELHPYNISIGKNFRRLRENAGLSQRKLAASVGVTASIISQYESGAKNPTLTMAKQLADRLGCKVDDFFDSDRKAV